MSAKIHFFGPAGQVTAFRVSTINPIMKATKTQTVLLMYENLTSNGSIHKEYYLSECELSETTFKRYISEMRCYLMNFHPGWELAYAKKDNVYYLQK